MGLLIGFLTVFLVLCSLFLMFLILLQLPKKEAGAGMAFGGGAAETLFGAGSGNVLTKLTKYMAGSFLGLCLILSVLHNHNANAAKRGLGDALKQKETPGVQVPAPAPAALPMALSTSTNTKAVVTTTNVLPKAK